MTAGMAARRPRAVANSASAMPGATTAREVLFEAAIDWKLVHDAPDRAEQADEGTGRADGGQEEETALETTDLAGDGDVEHLVYPRLEAELRTRAGLEAALPFAHGRDEDRRHALRRAAAERAVELLQRLAGPECLLEAVELLAHPRIEDGLVDDDRPHPDGGDKEADHHQLDDDVGLQEQRDERQVGTVRRRDQRYFGHPVHQIRYSTFNDLARGRRRGWLPAG
jgi:hypothetical protein